MSKSFSAIWVLTDNRPGTAAQALGVAEKLGISFETKKIEYTGFAGLPNCLLGASLAGLSRSTPLFTRDSSVPDLVIAAGRRSAPIARWIKKHNPDTRLVQLMRPEGGEKEFDLIAIPEHDRMRPAANVLRTTLTPHRLTAAALAEAAHAWRGRFSHLPLPRVAILVGGASKGGSFSAGDLCELTMQAEMLAGGGSLLVTTSRRTGAENAAMLKASLSLPHYFYTPDMDNNPYLAYLALADSIIVTGDSVSMVSEAVFTGKPVYIFAAPASAKHRAFHQLLYMRGLAAPLGEQGKFVPQPGLDAAAEIAQEIRKRFIRP